MNFERSLDTFSSCLSDGEAHKHFDENAANHAGKEKLWLNVAARSSQLFYYSVYYGRIDRVAVIDR